MNSQKLQKRFSSVKRAIQWTILDAALCGACAALYGIVFAGFGASDQRDTGRMVTTVIYFGLCGTFAGGVFGTIKALIDFAATRNSSDMVGSQDIADAVVAAGDLLRDSKETHYRTLAASSHQKQLETRVSRFLHPQFPRSRRPYCGSFVDTSQWEN